jgi:flavin-dependent dehydrogenase
LIPQSSTHAAVGFIAEEGKTARSRLQRFLDRMGLKAVEMQSARIPTYSYATRQWRKLSGADVYLVGDAAAQVKITTVGGLVTGLRGAKAAATAILRRSDYLRELKPLRRELGLHLLIRSLLNGFTAQDYDRLLGLMNERTIYLLGRYNRDQAARMVYRLLVAQPPPLKFGVSFARGFWRQSFQCRSRGQAKLIESASDSG